MTAPSLHETIQELCTDRTWSQGVKLFKNNAVKNAHKENEDVVIKVLAAPKPIPFTVVLYPQEQEWECSCTSRSKVCSHTAAAIIALKQDPDMAAEPESGRICYRFQKRQQALMVDRFVLDDEGGEEKLNASLGAILSGRALGPKILPEQIDLQIDHLLGANNKGRIPSDKVPELFRLLEGSGAPCYFGDLWVECDPDPIGPVAAVLDVKDDVVLKIAVNPMVDEIVSAGVVRCADRLHPMSQTEITGRRLENLPVELSFGSRIGDLVSTILPDIQQQIAVDVKSKRLPGLEEKLKPRIVMDVNHGQHRLSVMPMLVYGDPPRARIDMGKLVHLNGPIPVRDIPMEKQLVMQLRDELNLMPGRLVEFEKSEALKFAKRLQEWEAGGKRHPLDGIANEPELLPILDINGDEFVIEFEAPAFEGKFNKRAKGQRVEASTVISAWKDGLSMVPLQGGGWAPLPANWLAEHGHRVADLLAARDEEGKVRTFAMPDLAKLCDDLDKPRPPGLNRLAPLIHEFTELPAAELPKDLTADLREYQTVGVNWLSFLREAKLGAVLADDMGLGKTLQALCAIKGRALVVCPRSVLHNWKSEIEKFRPDLTATIYHGPKRKISDQDDVTLTTYALMRIDNEKLSNIRWDTLILDEAQAIKNPDSQVARSAFKMKAEFRVALSGTPVENRLEELWSQFHFVNRGLLGGRNDFRDRYSRPILRGEPGAAKRLRNRIRPFVLRRVKKEVAPELPPRTDMILHCTLDEKERNIYDAIRVATRKEIVEKLKDGGNVLQALEALLRLRQAACHAGLIPGQELEQSSKVRTLGESLQKARSEGHKALVFSQWTSLLDKIEPELQGRDLSYIRLDGSSRNRKGIVDKFQAKDGPGVMLVSLKAGGTGLNLTAADHVYLVDPWWNPAVEDQAADRAHRIGQDKPVMVYRLVTEGTVEERILKLQEKKREIADAALGDAHQAASLTRDDLLALLE